MVLARAQGCSCQGAEPSPTRGPGWEGTAKAGDRICRREQLSNLKRLSDSMFFPLSHPGLKLSWFQSGSKAVPVTEWLMWELDKAAALSLGGSELHIHGN